MAQTVYPSGHPFDAGDGVGVGVGEGLGDCGQPQFIILVLPHSSQGSPIKLISGSHGASHSAGI